MKINCKFYTSLHRGSLDDSLKTRHLKFGNSKLSAPFPSVLIKFARSCELFNDNGTFIFEKCCYFITQEELLKIF